MSEQKSVEELMKEYGYKFKGSCHCDGYETWKYVNGILTIKWRKRKYQYQVMSGRNIKVNWSSVLQLPETLKHLHSHVAVQE